MAENREKTSSRSKKVAVKKGGEEHTEIVSMVGNQLPKGKRHKRRWGKKGCRKEETKKINVEARSAGRKSSRVDGKGEKAKKSNTA